ncbi:MAG: serine/threonine protein kinase, partial [Myxococcaceae bacterium]
MNAPSPKLEILQKLGDGAVAEVFLGRAPGIEGPVVVKVLRPELTTDATVVGRFLDEANLCRGLDHENVVRHLATGRLPDGRVVLVTEHLEGEDLGRRLAQRGPLSLVELVKLAVPLCGALDYVHRKGIVHRDLKPDNVFLVGGLERFSPKLIDFGLALFKGNKSVRTANGVVLATPEYSPPECIDGQKADARSDLYSLGVLLYEAATGAPPFVAQNFKDLLLKHLHEPARPIEGPCAAASPAILRCLAKHPAERFASARELGEALAWARESWTAPTMMRGSGAGSSAPTVLESDGEKL